MPDSEEELVTETFTPSKVNVNEDQNYNGVTIRQFAKNFDQGKVMEFLLSNGLPENKKDNVFFKPNGVVVVDNLEKSACLTIIDSIHGKVYSGRTIYCSGIIPLTPEKGGSSSKVAQPQLVDSSIAISVQNDSNDNKETLEVNTNSLDLPTVKSPTFTAAKETFENIANFGPNRLKEFPSANTLVRRHSISLTNRTPPRNSVADELLATSTVTSQLLKTRDDLKELSDRMSEFSSCVSSSQANSSDESDYEKVQSNFKSSNERKRAKKNKRKYKLTPDKESFLKKPKN